MATRIKLKRLGKMRAPYYRIVVADARTKRDGRSIEEIGKYHPKEDPSYIEVDSDRVQYWLGVGAEPTEAVQAIFKVTGDWQRFKGLPAPEPMRTPAPRADRQAAFTAASRAAMDADEGGSGRGRRAPAAERAETTPTSAAAEPALAQTTPPSAAPAPATEGSPEQ